jgi:hypothetical protein
VHGKVEHVGIALEGRLRAVAVVHIPVDDEHPPHAVVLAHVVCPDCHVVKEAERTAQNALRTAPAITASMARNTPPAASRAAAKDPVLMGVSGEWR